MVVALYWNESGCGKEISNIPTGRTGYRGSIIPPVIAFVSLKGQLKHETQDTYAKSYIRSIGWSLAYRTLYLKDLSESIGKNILINNDDFWRTLPLTPYRRERSWPAILIQDTPDEQYIRFGIPRVLIEMQLKAKGLDSSEKWDTVKLDSLGMMVRISCAGFTVDEDLYDVTKDTDRANGFRYSLVRLHKEGHFATPVDNKELPDGFGNAGYSRPIDAPRQCYTLQVIDKEASNNFFSSTPLKVDFLSKENHCISQVGNVSFFFAAPVLVSRHMIDIGPFSFLIST